jgi:hypothetical protein
MMAPRLEVIQELKLSYEVPYLTDRGEIIDNITVQINEQRQGVDISYALLEPTEQNLDNLFPSSGVDLLAQMTKRILQDLGVNPTRIILQLWEYSPTAGLYSVEGRAPVNKQRDTVLIILTKTPFIYKFGYELVLWHQAMHAKDRWEHRFPSTHPLVEAGEWLDVLWHFSIDGRLQSWGKPHYSRAERLEEATMALERLCHVKEPQAQVRELCHELWGQEVTLAQLVEIGRGLGVGSTPGP